MLCTWSKHMQYQAFTCISWSKVHATAQTTHLSVFTRLSRSFSRQVKIVQHTSCAKDWWSSKGPKVKISQVTSQQYWMVRWMAGWMVFWMAGARLPY